MLISGCGLWLDSLAAPDDAGPIDARTIDAGADDQCTEASDCAALAGVCSSGVCNPRTRRCELAPVPDGTPCEDGDACSSGDACAGGTCVGEPTDCSDLDDVCVRGVCDPATGACMPVESDGVVCDDGDACTSDDVCSAGRCVDGCAAMSDACNVGSCNAMTGTCEIAMLPDGVTCDDEDLCTATTTCTSGVCAGPRRDCRFAGDQCNSGECDPATGMCRAVPVPDGTACDDGDLCTMLEACTAGLCTAGVAVDCSRLDDPCNAGRCAPASGECEAIPVADGTLCDDSNPCTTTDACVAGSCAGGLEGFRLHEVYGGTPDYIEVVNTGVCTLDIGGLFVQWSTQAFCGGRLLPGSFTFPSATVSPSGVYRVTDSTSPRSNEVYAGQNICDHPQAWGWYALCRGPCRADCSNMLDYFEKRSATLPTGTFACASFLPEPLNALPALFSDSATRVGFTGSGASGSLSDWALRPFSRD